MVAAILLELADEYEAVAAAQKIGTITDGEARAGGDAIPGAGLRKRPGSLIGRTANLTAAVRGRIIAAAR